MFERLTCLHCGGRPACRPRGLCWTCYYTPGVRLGYGGTSKFARLGSGVASDFVGPRPLPAEPTEHPPGTPGKLGVLAERAAAGEHLFHAFDAREPGDDRPRRWRERRGA